MKKTLAIAIAAGLAAPMAVMADTTLYGELHNSLDSVKVDKGYNDIGTSANPNYVSEINNVPNSKITSLSSNKSYLGVKGSEKISDGLSAVYKLEFGVNVGGTGAGNTGFKDRDQYVGLSGEKGTVVAGRASTPFKAVGRKADLFWSSQLGQNRTLTNPGASVSAANIAALGGTGAVNSLGWDYRANNVIAYFTPKMGGFSAAIAHVTEDSALGTGSTAWSGNLMYKAGGLTAGLGYETQQVGALSNAIVAGTAIAPENPNAARLMAAYDAGKYKVVGFYQKSKDEGGVKGADRKVWGIGGSVKTAKGAVKAQFYKAGDLGNLTLPVAGGTAVNNKDTGADLFAIGYDHNLSKRTTIYAQYAKLNNDKGASFALGGSGHGDTYGGLGALGETGRDISGISLGIKHDF